MSVRQRVPDALRGPLGAASLLVGIAGAVLGYIFTMLGVTLVFGLNDKGLTTVQSATVIATGLALVGVAYAGYKGFMTFGY